MNGRALILFALAIALPAPAAIAADDGFVARGNEPGWIVRQDADGLTFQRMFDEPATISPAPAPEIVEVYRSTVDGQPFVLTIADTLCVDTMSGMPHPRSVTVEIGEERLDGCGGEPASLLHGAWTIDRIDGSPLVDGSAVTLTFTEGGEINGNACNSYFGSFALTGEGLSITETGATLMACAEPLMQQEARYFDILGGIIRFDIAADGSLVLHAGAGRTIEASRSRA